MEEGLPDNVGTLLAEEVCEEEGETVGMLVRDEDCEGEGVPVAHEKEAVGDAEEVSVPLGANGETEKGTVRVGVKEKGVREKVGEMEGLGKLEALAV